MYETKTSCKANGRRYLLLTVFITENNEELRADNSEFKHRCESQTQLLVVYKESFIFCKGRVEIMKAN